MYNWGKGRIKSFNDGGYCISPLVKKNGISLCCITQGTVKGNIARQIIRNVERNNTILGGIKSEENIWKKLHLSRSFHATEIDGTYYDQSVFYLGDVPFRRLKNRMYWSLIREKQGPRVKSEWFIVYSQGQKDS